MKSLLITGWKCFLLVILFTCVLALNGCTVVKYKDGDKSLTIIDGRISGSAIDLDATLNNVGKLSVNREQGSVGEAAASVVEAAKPH